MTMSSNDWRVLNACRKADEHFDGFAPHGSRDWTAIRRLEREKLVECVAEFGMCHTCPTMHEVPVYRPTIWGMRARFSGAEA